ncbi:hypothetical protein Q9Q94_05875 [Uliginosibacterium sp. 31-16]|uniref:hypothetical protein n=1 Tax=Uliginosibacterium sp. 31-16 TaxID=3068315 RepID=UPI00273D9283|nr:hypothetical protein [Uliginosibacterium sp. 31-16]MDP5239049.1 hypothetical protein [Uliginosibacterium sp. 31-16]
MKKLLLPLVFLISGCGNKSENSLNNSLEQKQSASHIPWIYTASKDKMTDKISRSATLFSDDKLPEIFPYESAPVSISIYEDGDIYISSIGGHQFDCPERNGCDISIRFDGGNVKSYSAIGIDSSPPFLSIKNNNLINDIKLAKTILVQIPLFRHGHGIVKFDVTDFDPEKIRAAQP